VAPEALYEACRIARTVMRGEHAVGRVIARPFAGGPGHFERTDGRHDYALAPPRRSYLDELRDSDVPVHGVGKVSDLFATVGISESHSAATNALALAATTELLRTLPEGLIFTNLIDTDQIHGHRKDAVGFHHALQAIDAAVATWLGLLGPEDLLVLTADHGVDPFSPGSDHTREYVPLLVVANEAQPADGARRSGPGSRHDGPMADVGATVLRWLTGRETDALPGRPIPGLAAQAELLGQAG